MDRATFWELVERSQPGGDARQQVARLKNLLRPLDVRALSSFKRHLYELMAESYRGDVISVFSIIEPGCSTDSLHAFRLWLILQGHAAYSEILAHPEHLGNFDPRTSDFFNEELGSVTDQVYQEVTGQDVLPYDGPTSPPTLAGSMLSEEELKARYPDVWRRFRGS